MTTRIGLVVLLGAWGPAVARAEHHHDGGHAAAAGSPPAFAAGLELVGARFDTGTYVGDYQGVLPSIGWGRGRFGVTANLGLYRLQENGRQLHGIGDLAISGQATLVARGAAVLGVGLPVSLPTGDHTTGLGMGHVMIMPVVWASWGTRHLVVAGSAGYGHALDAATHHDHGAWPLVEPMNMQELTWSASADVPLGRAIRAGVRVGGGVAIGEGHDRTVGGVRTVWVEGRVETAAELQAGLAGDPFTIRGLVETAVHF